MNQRWIYVGLSQEINDGFEERNLLVCLPVLIIARGSEVGHQPFDFNIACSQDSVCDIEGRSADTQAAHACIDLEMAAKPFIARGGQSRSVHLERRVNE